MTKELFIRELGKRLSGLAENDVKERLAFYGEMIDDLIEEGYSQEEAIAKIGSVDEIATQILSDYPLSKIVKEKIKPNRKLKGWEILLLVLGSPVWLSLLIAAFAVILSLYIAVWSIIFSFWTVFVSFVCSFFGGVGFGIYYLSVGKTISGTAIIAAAVILAGLSIFVFFGSKAATKGTVILTKKVLLGIKSRFARKEKIL